MLSSIHPFGERSRNNSFGHTAAAHITGSAFGGAGLGLLAGAVGTLLTWLLDPTSTARSAVVLVSAVGALFLEATSRERLLPTRTRQVNENWIQSYRGWVYGGGWGAELGFGISTIISTTLVHLLVITMVMLGSFLGALLLGIVFGTARGATVLASRSVDSPERLRAFHLRLDEGRARSRTGAVLALGIAAAVGLFGIGGAIL